MTIMAAEAATGAATAGAAETAAGGRAAVGTRAPARRGGRTQQGGSTPAAAPSPARRGGRTQQAGGQRTGGRTQQGTQGGRRVRAKPQPKPPPPPSLADRYRTARGYVPSGGTSEGSNYERIVLAEFVLAVLLVAGTPFARQNRQGLSPYVGQDLVQLAAITILYFLLALMAGANRGASRLAAWLGGLILLTVGLAEAAAVASALDVFGIASKKQQAADQATAATQGAAIAAGAAQPPAPSKGLMGGAS